MNNEDMTPEAKPKSNWKPITRFIALVLGISLILALLPPNLNRWLKPKEEQNDADAASTAVTNTEPADIPAVSDNRVPERPTNLDVSPSDTYQSPFMLSYEKLIEEINKSDYVSALKSAEECLSLAENDEETVAAIAQKANALFLLENYSEAEDTYKLLIEMDADEYVSFRSVYTMLTRSLLLQEKLEDARAACDKALELKDENDNDSELYAISGVINLLSGEYRQAKADFERSLAEGYEDTELMQVQIDQCDQLILAEEAAASSPTTSAPVTSSNPEPSELEISATNYYFAGNYRQAAEAFGQLIGNSYYFTDMQLYSNIAKCYYLLGDYAATVDFCTKGLAQKGDSEIASLYTLRGSAYMTLGENALAADDFISAIQNGASDPLVNALQAAVCYYFSAEFEKSVAIGTPLIGQPGYEEAAFWVGLSEYMLGDLQAAVSHLGQCIDLEQNYCRSDELYRLITRCYFQLGDFEHAVEYSTLGIAEAESFEQRDNEIIAELYSLRGSSYMSVGEYEIATTDFMHALELAPTNYETLTQITLCSFLIGKYEDAANYGLLAMENGEHTADLTYWVGLSLFSTEHFSEARDVLSECLELDPNRENIWFYIGVCSFSLENFETAIEEFTHSIENSEPAMDRSLYNRAICYLQIEEYEKAKQDLEAAMQSENEDVVADANELRNSIRAVIG